MVSIFPPLYGLTPVLNVPESNIIEIIEFGRSDSFKEKAEKLYNNYLDSIGIDSNNLLFLKKLKYRCTEINNIGDKKIDFTSELNKAINFLKEYLENPNTYFKNYVLKGRRLKKINKDLYLKHKLSSVSYTPFGTFNSRENKSFVKSSNLLYFDIDIDLNKIQKRHLIEYFLVEPYIKTVWSSFSGKGFGFTVKCNWNTEEEMKQSYYKLVEYFTLSLKNEYGISDRIFDTQVCSLSRMNFLSYGMIKNKENFKIYEYENYSQDLFNLLHDTYKKDSNKEIPNTFLTNDNIKQVKYDFSIKEKVYIENSDHSEFLEYVTKNLSFNGTDDFNSSIKGYVSKIFRYNIDEYVIKDFLFSKIPYTKKTENNFEKLWSCYTRYAGFQTVDPFIYKK